MLPFSQFMKEKGFLNSALFIWGPYLFQLKSYGTLKSLILENQGHYHLSMIWHPWFEGHENPFIKNETRSWMLPNCFLLSRMCLRRKFSHYRTHNAKNLIFELHIHGFVGETKTILAFLKNVWQKKSKKKSQKRVGRRWGEGFLSHD